MELENALKKLAAEDDAEITPQKPAEWSPLPFGRIPAAANDDDEPLTFRPTFELKSAGQP